MKSIEKYRLWQKSFNKARKKAINFDQLYLLPKIYKELIIHNVPGRPVISNCGKPTERCLEFLEHYFKPIIENSWSHIKGFGDFINKAENLSSIHT